MKRDLLNKKDNFQALFLMILAIIKVYTYLYTCVSDCVYPSHMIV